MKKALVFVEEKNGELKKSSLEILSLFQGTDYEVHACALGAGADKLQVKLGPWNVSQFHMNNGEQVQNYNPEAYRQFMIQVIESVTPNLVLASSNMLGRDLFPRIAAKFDCAYMSDITEICSQF